MHVVAPAEFGGLERVVHTLAAGQVESGRAVEVVILLHDRDPDHPFVRVLAEAGIDCHVVRLPSRAYLREYRALRRLIRDRRPAVVHTHGYRCDIVGRRAAASEGVPVVSTSHGFSRGSHRNRAYEWLQRREYRRFDAVAAVSASMARELVATGVADARVVVLPNAVPVLTEFRDRSEARRALDVPQAGFRIGWIGRFAWAKGLDVFVQALSCIERTPWTASIIGAGPDGDSARAAAVEFGIADQIVWHGQRTGAARDLRAFDVLVISSRTEGTPMILLEAMAAGVPVVTTAVGGIPDVVSLDMALLVPPASPQALAAAIDDVRLNPDAALARARAASERLAAYDATAWVARYESIYRRVCTA